ncbi:hypothetical protein CALVIDRAFT_561473 [Calocera viscosa TUFC12733]|uniref:AB hydrolase-1 domain-containing protein n=1 Tax=Calocera viscosa (strain TUFC12733) TaxID=1330018 RepID=A0A167PRX9_CALVF|nr:hypothetical protein CALVIDRAFT_561473 [Calocera viscosa TUFC12733]
MPAADANYFTRPSDQPPGFVPFAARPLPPLRPVPLPHPTALPALPYPQRPSPFPDYELTTHLTPCAQPRAHRSATQRSIRPPYPPPQQEQLKSPSTREDKADRAREADALRERMWAQRVEMLGEPSWQEREEPVLWAMVNRFLRKERMGMGGGGGVTLFFVHANGYPKETWEPVIGILLDMYDKVDEIFVWETYNHGDAALVNRENLGDTFDWADNARDVLQFLLFYRPGLGAGAPVCLPPHERDEQRRVIGVGHSHGGEILVRAALHAPELFDALLLVEPVIIMETLAVPTRRASQRRRDELLLRTTLARRARWPSMEHARDFFARAPFFQSWHPAVLHAYVTYALCPLPSSSPGPGPEGKAVMLKQSPFDEASFYVEPRAPAETWFLLPLLDERVELRWVLGNDLAGFQGGEAYARHMVWRRPGNSSNTVIGEAGHFIPQQAPESLAREIADLLIRRDALPPAAQWRARL